MTIPTLDAPRPFGNDELFRTILDDFGELEPHIEEVDSCVALPLRLIHDVVAGFQIEIGPYTLDRDDIERLRAAIAACDLAAGWPSHLRATDDLRYPGGGSDGE